MRKSKLVEWDVYGIKNNPSLEALNNELNKLEKLQRKDNSFGWINAWKREVKLADLKRVIGLYKD